MVQCWSSSFADLFLPVQRDAGSLERAFAAAGAAHVAARRALALAEAEENREVARRELLAGRAHDLQGRALEALAAGREDLATRAAEALLLSKRKSRRRGEPRQSLSPVPPRRVGRSKRNAGVSPTSTVGAVLPASERRCASLRPTATGSTR